MSRCLDVKMSGARCVTGEMWDGSCVDDHKMSRCQDVSGH